MLANLDLPNINPKASFFPWRVGAFTLAILEIKSIVISISVKIFSPERTINSQCFGKHVKRSNKVVATTDHSGLQCCILSRPVSVCMATCGYRHRRSIAKHSMC